MKSLKQSTIICIILAIIIILLLLLFYTKQYQKPNKKTKEDITLTLDRHEPIHQTNRLVDNFLDNVHNSKNNKLMLHAFVEPLENNFKPHFHQDSAPHWSVGVTATHNPLTHSHDDTPGPGAEIIGFGDTSTHNPTSHHHHLEDDLHHHGVIHHTSTPAIARDKTPHPSANNKTGPPGKHGAGGSGKSGPHGSGPHGLGPHGLGPHGIGPHGVGPHGEDSHGGIPFSGHKSAVKKAAQKNNTFYKLCCKSTPDLFDAISKIVDNTLSPLTNPHPISDITKNLGIIKNYSTLILKLHQNLCTMIFGFNIYGNKYATPSDSFPPLTSDSKGEQYMLQKKIIPAAQVSQNSLLVYYPSPSQITFEQGRTASNAGDPSNYQQETYDQFMLEVRDYFINKLMQIVKQILLLCSYIKNKKTYNNTKLAFNFFMNKTLTQPIGPGQVIIKKVDPQYFNNVGNIVNQLNSNKFSCLIEKFYKFSTAPFKLLGNNIDEFDQNLNSLIDEYNQSEIALYLDNLKQGQNLTAVGLLSIENMNSNGKINLDFSKMTKKMYDNYDIENNLRIMQMFTPPNNFVFYNNESFSIQLNNAGNYYCVLSQFPINTGFQQFRQFLRP